MGWLSFDLDGTLADWPFRRVVRPWLEPFLAQPEVRRALREEYLRRLAQGSPAAFDWGDIQRTVAQRLDLKQPFPDLERLLGEVELHPSLLYPEVLSAVRALRALGYRIAVATNGLARYQRVLLDRLGLPYDRLLAPDLTQTIKPNPSFWSSLDGAAALLVHVGDLLSQDVWGAQQAGILAVWVWREMPPDWRRTPPAERARRPDVEEVVAAQLRIELEEHGLAPHLRPQGLPRPDYVVADLGELVGLLEMGVGA
ncbi:MAG: HAD family hydrolase [Meiothermus sp.]|uniref:HAD family hydrolase n=1 Tax=Meiothermus sp. TaxID=1955249 RepID=UPI00298F060A|nr:HAD family hydrolase [Meiothermus sp.]MDW8091875.1 HAD family hydrolase [Meiothermus sp.]MDW8482120.1 HAD family hydrolase [Meiothermus sp.]